MVTSPNSPEIPTTFTSIISKLKKDTAVKKIQPPNKSPIALKNTSPIGVQTLCGGGLSKHTITPMDQNKDITPPQPVQDLISANKPSKNIKQEETEQKERNDEHVGNGNSPTKSSIWDITENDFFLSEIYKKKSSLGGGM